MQSRGFISRALLLTGLMVSLALPVRAEPLRVGYSDWPGWVAWEVAIEKGLFAEAGVEVEFEWFDYVASMDAFAAGQLDAICITNGDALVIGASGAANVAILINDYSNGNDMVVGAPGIADIKALKGKKIGVEIGFVGHLLLLNALEKHGMTEANVRLVNVPTNETPQALASGDVSAIVAWQPNSGQALSLVPGAKRLYSSAAPASLAARRADWAKVIDVWYRAVDFIMAPATREEAIAIMAARVGVSAEQYKPFLAGARILQRDEAGPFFASGDGFDSIYGSSRIADDFNRKYEVYQEAQDIEAYIDPSLTLNR